MNIKDLIVWLYMYVEKRQVCFSLHVNFISWVTGIALLIALSLHSKPGGTQVKHAR